MTVNWGILATGNISDQMAQALTASPEANVVAVASRAQAKADAFGARWDIPNRYSSYEALAADPAVEVVYIGTPHSHHYDNMLLCLEAGKHVLCEKAFTLNARQAEQCVTLARERGLFLMEAMWTRFIPAMQQVKTWLADGAIGDIRLVQADFCIDLPFDPANRLYNPALGGGALLDLGIYPLSLATNVLGLPAAMQSHAHLGATGVDELAAITLLYADGAAAQLACSMRLDKPAEAHISGSAGYIRIHDRFLHPEWLTIKRAGQTPHTVRVPYAGNGYGYEAEAVHRCLQAGKTESDVMPLDETLALMRLMDQCRAEWGVTYPGE